MSTEHHRHDWQTNNDGTGYNCTECADTCTACTSPLRDGTPCGAPTETGQPICPTCLEAARQLPHHIYDGYRQLPDIYAAIAGLHAIRYDRDRRAPRDDGTMPGGDLLTMTTPGNPEAVGRNTWDPAAPQDPEPVPTFLTRWEDEWRRTKGDPIPATTNLPHTVTWLDQHSLWAARNLDPDLWATYLTEARHLRATINRYTGQSHPPVKEPTPCVYCGNTITRAWDQDGLSDTRTCTGPNCGRTWESREAFWRISRQAILDLPETHPDRDLTIADILLIYPNDLTRAQLDQWAKRGHITPTGTDTRGNLTYRLSDITNQLHKNNTT